MFTKDNLENQIVKNEKKIKELSIQMETLDKEVGELLNELDITPEQLTQFIQNPENFSEKTWEDLQRQRKNLDEKLQRDLNNVSNPKKTKNTYKKFRVPPNWIPVR